MSTLDADADQPAPPPSLAGGYRPLTEVYDEMAGPDGQPRSHWQKLISFLERLAPGDFASRRESAYRILREHGVTYNVYGDEQGLGRPWALDLVPLLIPAAEWRVIEAGLVQRARLLNLILADFYGAQRLLREGGLPPAVLFANPGFLRQCHGMRPPNDGFIFLHAVDLARSPDGQWWVLSDRTQAPSGAGYALENRIVVSRVFPDEFRDCHVERLSTFYQVVRDTLRALPRRGRRQPNVVLLTPGPYNETYFEHVYLARYLGFQLVEGGDLTVRDRRVFLKTLEGLQPVDVILRRVDDTFCDPLELRADSCLGVPGLLDAARAGNVVVANALGSAAAEAPVLTAFLPALSRLLLGEDLKLPSVATWWCGQEKERDYVGDHLHELVIKRSFERAGGEPVFGGALTEKERMALLEQIESAPFEFIAQEQVALSTVPVWEEGRLDPRPLVLRAFVCASADGFTVMPGSLARFSTSTDRLVVSMQSGGGSKDTWILADGPVSQLTLLKSLPSIVRHERAAAEVPSRVADNLFWLGRYAERLEDTVRLLRCVLIRLAGEAGSEETPDLAALVRLLAKLDLFPSKFFEQHTLAGVEREAYMLIYQTRRLGAVREVLRRLSHIAFALRDRFSADTWGIVTKLQLDARPRPGRIPISEALALLNALIVDLAAFAGMEMENMTRGHGWRFLDVGRRLERATNVTTLVQAGLALEPDGSSVLDPILEIADSVMTYRRRYFAQPQWTAVLDLLLADETNPRSLAFQVNALADHVSRLPRPPGSRGRSSPQIDSLRGLLRRMDLTAISNAQPGGSDSGEAKLLGRVAAELRSLSDSLTHQYFAHATAQVS